MKITLSIIKADIGAIGGHMAPSTRLLETVRRHVQETSGDLLIDSYLSYTGDDIALLLTHNRGTGDNAVHQLAWDALMAGTEVARAQGLYGAGQDLVQEAFSANVRGMGPAVAEMEIDERPNEPFLFFAADKTDPGAYNLPLYLAFADPMNTPGLILSQKLAQGFRFVIMDVTHTACDRVIELLAPEELYDIAALLRDPQRYVIESVWSRTSGEQAAVVSTARLRDIAGKHTGKDDPVLLIRTQMHFPSTGELLAPFQVGHFVAGGLRGSHNMPLMPCLLNSPVSYFDGPPTVTCAAFACHEGRLTEAVDAFAHPFWNSVRERTAAKAMEIRRQGFFGSAMLPIAQLEYTGVAERLEQLQERFQDRAE